MAFEKVLNIFNIVKNRINHANRKYKSDTDPIQLLSYRDVVKYFVLNRPQNETIAKGMIMLKSKQKGYVTIWRYLDKNNNAVCNESGKELGRNVFVKDFDDELKEYFNGTELLIIE